MLGGRHADDAYGSSADSAPLAARIGESVRERGGNYGFDSNRRGDMTALRTDHDGQDSEVRQEAALIRKTASSQLVRPTLVSLDFHDRPMSEVIREVSAKTRCRLRILETQRTWLAERITLHTPEPVPFWKAVDKLCEAGRFQSNLGVDAEGACVALFRNETTGPTSDFGPFRVQIEEIYFNRRYRQLHLPEDRSSRPFLPHEDGDSSFIELRVMVEPRMKVRQ